MIYCTADFDACMPGRVHELEIVQCVWCHRVCRVQLSVSRHERESSALSGFVLFVVCALCVSGCKLGVSRHEHNSACHVTNTNCRRMLAEFFF